MMDIETNSNIESSQESQRTFTSFKFSDPQQIRIHKNLCLFGPGPAAMFRDACAIMQSGDFLLSQTHIIGHLFREILGAILGVLIPPDKEAELSKGNNCNVRKAKFAIDRLGFSETHFVSEFWIGNIIHGDFQLHRLAHRSGLSKPRPRDEEFREFWSNTLYLFDKLLNASRDHMLDISRPFEKIAAKENPNAKDVADLEAKLPHHPIYLHRVLQKISSPVWIKLLDERGFFENPPEAAISDGTIQADPWPQGRFLEQMASKSSQEVCGIVTKIPWPMNPYFLWQMIDVIENLTPEDASKVIPKVEKWIDMHGLTQIDHKICELIKQLAANDLTKEALRLAEKFLQIGDSEETNARYWEPCILVHSYQYTEVLTEGLKPIAKKDAYSVLLLLFQILSKAVDSTCNEFRDKEQVSDLHNCMVAPDSVQRPLSEVMQSLVNAICDCSQEAIDQGVLSTQQICEWCDNHEYRIFTRIKLYLLANNASQAIDLVEGLLTNEKLFNASWINKEFNFLAEKGFEKMATAKQSRHLNLIAKIPEQNSGDTSESKGVETYQRWQYARLRPIADHLPEQWATKYESLNSKYEDDYNRSRELQGFGFSRVKSPFTDEELGNQEIENLVEVIGKWTPNAEDFPRNSRLELNRSLGRLVESKPEFFTKNFETLKTLPADSLWHVLSGFREAMNNGQEVDWQSVLAFSEWVYAYSFDPGCVAVQPDDAGPTNHQAAIRQYVLELVEQRFRVDDLDVESDELNRIIKIIEQGLEDVDPSIESQKQSSGSMGPLDASLNCILGRAFLAFGKMIKYIVDDEALQEAHWPKLRELLHDYLETEARHRYAAHAAIGSFFPYLMEIDEQWSLESLDEIMPMSDQRLKYFAAAWDGYVFSWRPGEKLLTKLRTRYLYACENSSNILSIMKLESTLSRMWIHIIDGYSWEAINLDDDDSLLEFAFKNALGTDRLAMLQFAGDIHIEDDSDKAFSTRLSQRMEALYEWRRSNLQDAEINEDLCEELWAIQNWLEHDFHEPEWWLTQVEEVLKLCNRLPDHIIFVEHLAGLTVDFPERVIQITELIVDAERSEWAMIRMGEHLSRIFSQIIELENTKSTEKVKRIINRLSTHGAIGFDELLD